MGFFQTEAIARSSPLRPWPWGSWALPWPTSQLPASASHPGSTSDVQSLFCPRAPQGRGLRELVIEESCCINSPDSSPLREITPRASLHWLPNLPNRAAPPLATGWMTSFISCLRLLLIPHPSLGTSWDHLQISALHLNPCLRNQVRIDTNRGAELNIPKCYDVCIDGGY